jgi:hypothetical protein
MLEAKATEGSIPARVAVWWVVAFIVWGILRQKLAALPELSIDGILTQVSVLEVLEVWLIFRLASRIPDTCRLPATTAWIVLGVIALVVVVVRYRPSYASGGLELMLLVLSWRTRPLRLVAICVTLFVFQYIFQSGPFLWLHESIGRVDAAVLRGLLAEAGYVANGFGPMVYLEGSTHGVNVMGACSSSHVVGTMTAGYLIIVAGLRGRFVADDASWLAGLLVTTICVNWLRLAPMVVSPQGHAFWHDGLGASIVSLVYAALVLAAVHVATKREAVA